VISLAEQLIRARGDEIAIENIVLDDKKTFDMLGRGETVGVFQLESVGMRKALAEMRADRFEDIIALVALYRPGPMANIPVYNARKLGHETPDYIHPKLESCLKETYGVIIYQEQVMQIAQILSGYSLGEADLLRRAMGKKIKAEMDAQRERFVSGAMERGLDKATSNTIFDLLAKFADYGFNKSHAAAYALVAYQTAFLKANYPLEFMAASMTLDMSNTDKLSEFRREVQRLGFKVEPPSINRSGVTFEVHPDREGLPCIRYALAALKGVGRQAVESLVATREGAPFQDVSDLARRINPRLFNKRTLESLISAGAMDEIEPDRARAFASIEAIMAEANRTKDEASAGQSDIFGGLGKPEPLRISGYKAWSNPDRLQREYDAIGFFLSGHPLDEYSGILRRLRVQSWVEFVRAVKSGATAGKLAATVLDRTERRTRTGNKMGILSLSDQTGHFESIIFQEGLVQYRELLEPGTVVILSVQASVEGDEVRSRIQSVEPLEQVAARLPSSIRVAVNEAATVPAIASELKERGDGEVFVVVSIEGGTKEVEIKLPGRFRATPQLAGSLRMLSGVSSVEHA
jgi:DNA polymerase-3 subunit alpha